MRWVFALLASVLLAGPAHAEEVDGQVLSIETIEFAAVVEVTYFTGDLSDHNFIIKCALYADGQMAATASDHVDAGSARLFFRGVSNFNEPFSVDCIR
tara:strand:- start:125 stop:418 length:294 start_codon:yes stop_codon:yes gene_type:complete